MKTLLLMAFLCPFVALSQTKTVSSEILKKAEREYSAGDFENAILDYSKVIELNPNDAWWWMARGQARFKNKDTTGALSDLNKCVQVDTNFSNGYFQLAYVKLQAGDKNGAEWDYNKSADLTHPFFDKGRIEFKKGNFNMALKDFQIALSLHTTEPDIYFELALTEKLLGNNFNSDFYFERATKIYQGLHAK